MNWTAAIVTFLVCLVFSLILADENEKLEHGLAVAIDSVTVYRAQAEEAEERMRAAERRAWCYTEEIARLRLWYEPPDAVTATHLYWNDPCRPGDKNRFWTVRIW